jgi:drug/metabolite transporter (DMT)-like permease
VTISKVSTFSTWSAVVALIVATVVWGFDFRRDEAVACTDRPCKLLGLALRDRCGSSGRDTSSQSAGAIVQGASTGARLGLLLGLGFLLQTIGLQSTASGISGFLTGTSVILTTVAAAAFFSERVGPAGWAAVGVAAFGVVLLAVGGTLTPTQGALLTLGGGRLLHRTHRRAQSVGNEG